MNKPGYKGVVKVQYNRHVDVMSINIPKETVDDLHLQPQQHVKVEKNHAGEWILRLFHPEPPTNEECYA